MAIIYRERMARVPHECAWECGDVIQPGERYLTASLTPGDPEIGNASWLHHALHGRSLYDCPCYAARKAEAPGNKPGGSVVAEDVSHGLRD